jgi:predicted Zn finger-like uncharacterized protein
MLIVCPSCATSYMLNPGSLGPAGRMVRCARCKTAWFADEPKAAAADVSGYVENVIAEAEAESRTAPQTASAAQAPEPHRAPPVQDQHDHAADDFSAEAEAPIGQISHQGPAAPHTPQEYTLPAEQPPAFPDAPSLVPPMAEAAPGHAELDDDDVESFAARRARMQAKRKTRRKSSKWTAVILVLFGFNVALVGARNEVVHYMPQTASLFAAIGLPVNLRHLTFQNVKISNEENDGVNVLVVEGSILSSSNKAVEVPRLRFAVRNASGQEVYSWTAQPTRTVLGPDETLPFRSRLASPPADASDVVVRFVTARDAIAGPK